jgi:hypothetical protein
MEKGIGDMGYVMWDFGSQITYPISPITHHAFPNISKITGRENGR